MQRSNMKKLLVVGLLVSINLSANAGFVDNRSDPNAVIEANYKSVSVDDLALGIVPPEFKIFYQSESLKQRRVTAVGKGGWADLLHSALASSQLKERIDVAKRAVYIDAVGDAPELLPVPTVVEVNPAPPVNATPSAAERAASTAVVAVVRAPEAVAATEPPVATVSVARAVYSTKFADGFVSGTVANWARLANMQLVWEPGDVDYPVQAENFWGADIRSAIDGLFNSLAGARTPLRACFHPNKPRAVLRVIRAGDLCTQEG